MDPPAETLHLPPSSGHCTKAMCSLSSHAFHWDYVFQESKKQEPAVEAGAPGLLQTGHLSPLPSQYLLRTHIGLLVTFLLWIEIFSFYPSIQPPASCSCHLVEAPTFLLLPASLFCLRSGKGVGRQGPLWERQVREAVPRHLQLRGWFCLSDRNLYFSLTLEG